MKKRKNILYSILLLSVISVSSPIHAETFIHPSISSYESPEEDITPYVDDIDWVYEIVDGKLYRRLYNYTTGQWVGDWELVP